jgi:hypothetical protein
MSTNVARIEDPAVQGMLRTASENTRARRTFVCRFLSPEGNAFVEHWAPIIYDFLGHALGPYGKEPLPEILLMPDGQHSAGATASFDPNSGQVRLCTSVDGKPGQILEKMTHEFTHGSLALFPEGDPFYEEGFVDYSVWVMAHAPVWAEHREQMIEAAAFNIKMRRERAMLDLADWDRKRWAGGLYAALSRGPFIIGSLRHRKAEGNYSW